MFADLLREPGVIEHLELRGPIGVMALHGGALERMTDVMAARTAESADASFYAVVQPRNLRWHIPSVHFDPAASRQLARFLEHIEVAISLHGYGADAIGLPAAFAGPTRQALGDASRSSTVLLGGRNRPLARSLAAALRGAFPSIRFVDDLSAIPRSVRGRHRANPVNRPRQQGVQVELPPAVRGYGPQPLEPGEVERFADTLGRAARAWLDSVPAR